MRFTLAPTYPYPLFPIKVPLGPNQIYHGYSRILTDTFAGKLSEQGFTCHGKRRSRADEPEEDDREEQREQEVREAHLRGRQGAERTLHTMGKISETWLSEGSRLQPSEPQVRCLLLFARSFDASSLSYRTFVTGFRKRKEQRRETAKKSIADKEKAAKRKEKREKMRDMLDAYEKRTNEMKNMLDGGDNDSDDIDDSESEPDRDKDIKTENSHYEFGFGGRANAITVEVLQSHFKSLEVTEVRSGQGDGLRAAA
eukprot:768285-Hanusia_phi.AAC.1